MKAVCLLSFAAALHAGTCTAQMGSIDPTFNPGDLGFGFGDGPNAVNRIVVQPDGNILLGGCTDYNGVACGGVVRIAPDGTLDGTFITGGGANGPVWDLALQPDGKIIIGGNFTSYNGIGRNRIARLNTDGSLDVTFDAGAGPNGGVEHLVLQPDGKVLVAGAFTECSGTAAQQLCRLVPNGALDPSFNAYWVGLTDFSVITSLCLEPNGMLLIGGASGGSGTGVARLSNTGYYEYDYHISAPGGSIGRIVKLSDGNVLVAGGGFWQGNPIHILQLRDEWGALVTDLAAGGLGPNGGVGDILEIPGNKVVICGGFTSYAGVARDGIARLNNDGTLDQTFTPGEGYGVGGSLARQADGKVLATGGVYGLVRVETNGGLDPNFPLAGTGANGEVHTLLVQPDGQILFGGSFEAYNGTVSRFPRTDPDGNVDSGFNPLASQFGGNILHSLLQPDGRVLLTGDNSPIARLNSDGTVDNGFQGPQTDAPVMVTAVQPDGKILIGGDFTQVGFNTRVRVARLNADGSLHSSFDPGGGPDGVVRAILPLVGGKALIAGDFTNYNGVPRGRIAQLNADGTLDASFAVGSGADGSIRSIVRQYDGRIVVAGDFYLFNGTYCPNITRLNADGSLDPTFSSGLGTDAGILCMLMQADGFILIGGEFTIYNGTGRNRIARLNNDGSLDIAFNPGSGASARVNTLALQADGQVLIGGAFTSYDGTGRNRVARINNTVGTGYLEIGGTDLSTYPNPTTHGATLQIPAHARPQRLHVYDDLGRLVQTRTVAHTSAAIFVDLSAHASGPYVLRVQMQDGSHLHTRVVKD